MTQVGGKPLPSEVRRQYAIEWHRRNVALARRRDRKAFDEYVARSVERILAGTAAVEERARLAYPRLAALDAKK